MKLPVDAGLSPVITHRHVGTRNGDAVSVSHINYPPRSQKQTAAASDTTTASVHDKHIILPPKTLTHWSKDVPQYSYEGQHAKAEAYAANIPSYFYDKSEAKQESSAHHHSWNDEGNPKG